MYNKQNVLKDVADYWRKVKSGELPAPGPNEINVTALAVDEAVSRIAALLAELEAKDKRITTVTEEREFWRERVEGAEKEREEFRRRFNLERSYTEDADKRIARLEGTRFITWPGNMFAPVLAQIKVDVKRRDGSVSVGQSGGNVVWYHQDRPDDVVAFALTAEGEAQPVMPAIPDISSIVINDAAWKLHDSLTEHGPLNRWQFNNLKGCLYEALKIVMSAPPASATPDAVDIFADQVIGTKTKVIRMPAPLNVPQEGIRVYLNADTLIRTIEQQGYQILIEYL